MKKCRWIALCLLLALLPAACGGDVRHAELAVGPSELYTDAEIGDAMDVVLDHFRKEFDGCTLTWLGYDFKVSHKTLHDGKTHATAI